MQPLGDEVHDEEHEKPSEVVIEGSVAASSVDHVRVAGPDSPIRLTEMQDAFVTALLENGGKIGPAALTAGAGHETYGHRLLAKRKVQDELARRVKLQHGSALAIGLTGLFRIIEHGEDERAVVAASVALLDRFGLAPPKGPAVAVQINNIGAPQVASILQDVAERRAQRLALSAPSSDNV